MTRRRVAALVLAAGALLLTSCTSPDVSPEQYLPEPAALQPAVDCSTATGWEATSTGPAALLKGRVPDGFVTAEVVRCMLESMNNKLSEDHLTGDYAPLLAALAESSERGPASCLDYGEILPSIWLINAAGQAINIQWPLDSCDHSKPGTAAALVTLTVTRTEPVPAKDAAP
ncbi:MULTISPECIES: hypothetical protein [Arthrobacter]|uniref:hypothetical protein n=1 Tax=Arthrobacter TaxID=1663 RepID=UPI0005363328|nr:MULTISPECIES: hypothetical protein [Arthrobacter]AIY03926.1 hypothetical protein ART_4327 [Arthrobacter sp. PAMC 25486]